MLSKEILLVEPNDITAQMVVHGLGNSNFHITHTTDIVKGLAIFKQNPPNLLIVDLSLPGLDGLNFCQQIRSNPKYHGIPIFMLSALSDIQYKVEAFDAGIDNYIVKPFFVQELLLKIKAMLGRIDIVNTQDHNVDNIVSLGIGEVLHAGEITLLPESREAKFCDQVIHFTPLEFEILHCLMQNLGSTISPIQLITEIWGHDASDDIETIRVHIRHLRQRLEKCFKTSDGSPTQKFIKTIYGKGYQLIPNGFLE